MIKVSDAFIFVKNEFTKKRQKNAYDETRNLFAVLLNCSFSELLFLEDRTLTEKEWKCCQFWVEKRLEGFPLAYLKGSVEFYGCLIEVNSFVLIPRHETEILVDKIVSELKPIDLVGKSLCDLGSGSGCIAISLKKNFPALKVFALEISYEAASLLERNAEFNHVSLEIYQGDLLFPLKNQKIDYFVSNPPYISLNDYSNLEKDVLLYEPKQALVGGEKGWEFYEKLEKVLPDYLADSAYVWFEIGYDQGDELKKIFNRPYWEKITVEKDWASHDRFFSCRFNLQVYGSLKFKP